MSIREYNKLLNEHEYLEALRLLRDNTDLQEMVNSDDVYKLAVNALFYNNASLHDLLELVKDIDKEAYDKLKNNLEDIVSGYIQYLRSNDKYDELSDLADELENLDEEWARKLALWARLYANPYTTTSYYVLKEAINNNDWEKAYKTYTSLSYSNRELIDKILQVNGIDPHEFYKTLLVNTFIDYMKKKEINKAEKLLDELRDHIDKETYTKLRTWLLVEKAEKCTGNPDCLEELLDSTSNPDTRKKIFIVWITPMLQNPFSYPREALEVARDYAEKLGFMDLAEHLDQILKLDNLTDEYIEETLETLKQVSQKIYNDIKNVLETGDPEKIREFINKNKELLSGITIDNVSLKDYLEAAAWLIENRKTITDILEKINTYSREIQSLKGSKPEPRLVNELENTIHRLEGILNNKYISILEKTRVLDKETLETLTGTLGYLYYLDALAHLLNGDTGKADELAEKASRYDKEYMYMYTITKNSIHPDIPLLECIVNGYELTSGEGYVPEKIDIPLRTGGVLRVTITPPTKTILPSRPRTPQGEEHAPIPV